MLMMECSSATSAQWERVHMKKKRAACAKLIFEYKVDRPNTEWVDALLLYKPANQTECGRD